LNSLIAEQLNDFDFEDRESLWRAIEDRDSRYYSRFVYGVISTGIFCRPTCASRKPKNPDGVFFFENSTEAVEAGYRPCERCRPEENEPEGQIQRIQKLCEFINENSGEKLTLERLSRESGISQFHLQRSFKRVTGLTPKEYTEAVRLGHLRLALKSGESVRKSTYRAGYNTSAWLYFRPNEKLGMSPLKYKNGGEGLSIQYSITDTPLGKLLVAATERGVCFVTLGESSQKLVQYLRSEYPKAKFESAANPKNKSLSLSVQKIAAYITQGTDLKSSNLTLDLQATAFQWRVWKELREIPYGSVRSYSEVAKRIGLPKATRAVANACASNPVPIVIPCHRVVPKTGGIGNYGLGVARKKALLEKEGVDLGKLDAKVLRA
jgi:AraC family transcriptional regulator of adaptative response/methylated-DNA-[protein]-cysteine methyltransferase